MCLFFVPIKSIMLKFIYSEKANKNLRNLHLAFVLCSSSHKLGGDFAKFCGLLRIYELYKVELWTLIKISFCILTIYQQNYEVTSNPMKKKWNLLSTIFHPKSMYILFEDLICTLMSKSHLKFISKTYSTFRSRHIPSYNERQPRQFTNSKCSSHISPYHHSLFKVRIF